MGFG
jgi:hypothetical protein